jgi:preprotein translocase subunit SecB
MSTPPETPPSPAAPAVDPARPPILVKAQYIKDFSFEVPNAPGVFALLATHQPEIGINLDVEVRPLPDATYEVVLHVKSECRFAETVGFILELTYGGVFLLNVPDDHREPVLLVECPRLIFPFVRQIVADATRDGGFPPVMLTPVDFIALFREKARLMAAESGVPSGVTPS